MDEIAVEDKARNDENDEMSGCTQRINIIIIKSELLLRWSIYSILLKLSLFKGNQKN